MGSGVRPPPKGFRIAVADDEADTRQFYQEWLPEMGHQVVAVAADGRHLVMQCRATHPDLIITDIKLPDTDGLDAAEQVNADREVPVILVSAYKEGDLLARALAGHVMAYLVKPVKPADLQAAIHMAMARFQNFQQVRAEADGLRKALEERKAVEQAKGVVMRRLGLDEVEAYKRLRRLSHHRNEKVVDLSRRLLEADQVFRSLEDIDPPGEDHLPRKALTNAPTSAEVSSHPPNYD
jgi:response regulator NasT